MTTKCPTCGAHFLPATENGVFHQNDQAVDSCWEDLTAGPDAAPFRRRTRRRRGRWFWVFLLGCCLHLGGIALWIFLMTAPSRGAANPTSPPKQHPPTERRSLSLQRPCASSPSSVPNQTIRPA
jgi:hypothetical protein